jgi:hypothetical protein
VKYLILITLVISSSLSFAETRVGNGGELRWRSDYSNPWWVINTKKVSYCVEIDESRNSIDLKRFKQEIKRALFYWQDQFKDYHSFMMSYNTILGAGVQTFTYENCSNKTDLRFYLGKGSLSKSELKYFQSDYENLVGIAIREKYDKVNLKAKGFIYIKGDDEKIFAKNRWSTPNLLKRALIHELGHVFGIGHIQNTFMDTGALSIWFGSEGSGYGEFKIKELDFFRAMKQYSFCYGAIFGRDKKRCSHVGMFSWGYPVGSIFSSEQIDKKKVYLGKLTNGGGGISSDVAIQIFLPKMQVVFATKFADIDDQKRFNKTRLHPNTINYPAAEFDFNHTSDTTKFEDAKGNRYPAFFKYSNTGIQLYYSDGKKIYYLLNHHARFGIIKEEWFDF